MIPISNAFFKKYWESNQVELVISFFYCSVIDGNPIKTEKAQYLSYIFSNKLQVGLFPFLKMARRDFHFYFSKKGIGMILKVIGNMVRGWVILKIEG